MKYNKNSSYEGGIIAVDLSPKSQATVIPDSIDFRLNEGYTINVNLWIVQAIRRNIEIVYSHEHDIHREDKIQFIKALRRHLNVGLIEAKKIAEWFMDNVDRDVVGKL